MSLFARENLGLFLSTVAHFIPKCFYLSEKLINQSNGFLNEAVPCSKNARDGGILLSSKSPLPESVSEPLGLQMGTLRNKISF